MPRKFEHGYGIVFDPGSDKPIEEHGTTQCVHCGGHFIMRKGSGKTRGFCMVCNGIICGPRCAECKPFERWLEEVEGTKNPTAVSSAVPQGQVWTPGMP